MDEVTIKSELVDPLSWREVSKMEEYLEESLPDHQNDVDMMATENSLNIFLEQEKLPGNKQQKIQLIKAENELYQLKEDFPLAGSSVDIKQESSFDASGDEEILRTTIKEKDFDFIKTEESVDFGTLGPDVDVMVPPIRRSSRRKTGNLFLEQTKMKNELRQLKEDSSLENIYIKEERSFDTTGEDEVHKIKREEDLDIKSEENLEESFHYGTSDHDLSKENHNRNPFSSLKDEKNQVDDREVVTISDEDKNPTAKRLYSCSYCDYKTTIRSHIVRHFRSHTGEKPFPCSYCDYRASEKSHLRRHLRSHTGEKPFSCSQCDYKSSEKSRLGRHLRSHTGEKPFSCSYCDYRASDKSRLGRHLRTHTREKTFSCSHCDYKANLKSSLVIHLRSHTGEKTFSCSDCDYIANQKSALVRHFGSHTGEKPFSCSHCDYKANQKSNLESHLRIHAGEKPFSCSHCDYKATHKRNLVRHLKKHTGANSSSCL